MEILIKFIGILIIGFVVLLLVNGAHLGGLLPKKLRNSRYRILLPLKIFLSFQSLVILFILFL